MKTSPPPSSAVGGFGFPPLHQRWRGGRKGVRMFFVFSFLALFLLSDFALASYISFKTTLNTKVVNDKLEIFFKAVNQGDEPAYSVQAEVLAKDQKVPAQRKDELGVAQTYDFTATLGLKARKAGVYPLVVILHYTDANQYPFSALSCQTFPYQTEAVPSDIFGQMKGDFFWKEGKLKLTLRNMSDAEVRTSTYFVAPRELRVVDDKSRQSIIPARSESEIVFPVKNFSALGGSGYQVFAITEFEKEGIHQTSITPAMVKIMERKQILGMSYTVVIAFLIILLLFFITAQFIRKK